MTERITIEALRKYFLDRVQELFNQEKNGDPFVILSTRPILRTVNAVKGVAFGQVNSRALSLIFPKLSEEAIRNVAQSIDSMSDRLTANDCQQKAGISVPRSLRVEFSHKEPTKEEMLKVVINVHDLLVGLEQVVMQAFSDSLGEGITAKIEDHFNKPDNKPIGLNK